MLKAVILIGGPQKGEYDSVTRSLIIIKKYYVFLGTRFRPLSLDIPKPLFPVAGRPIIQHHIDACVQLADIKEILIIGYYPVTQMDQFIRDMQAIYDDVSIRFVSCVRVAVQCMCKHILINLKIITIYWSYFVCKLRVFFLL